jgi:uncharacterized protein YndB with AHSA1/START domain
MATEMAAQGSKDAAAEFVLSRVFDAPRDLVWKAHTDRERLAQWWGPKGFTMGIIKLDFHPGGVFHYSMRTPTGQELWGRFVYREIVKPERIAFVLSFSDQHGGVTRNPWSPTWPLEVLNIQTFSEHDGKTTLTLRGVPINAADIERETFEAGHASMQQGFKGTLDQLADYLAKA